MGSLPEREMEDRVCNFYYAIKTENIEAMLAVCAENISLAWGPFQFDGQEELKRWATEMWYHFKDIKFARFELQCTPHEDTVSSMFDIEVTNLNGPRGRLVGSGAFELFKGKIQDIKINLLSGFIFCKQQDMM